MFRGIRECCPVLLCLFDGIFGWLHKERSLPFLLSGGRNRAGVMLSGRAGCG